MIFLSDLKQDEKGFRADSVHSRPFDPKEGFGKTEEELRQEGVLVEALPELEQREGKIAVLYCDGVSRAWYEYVDRPLTDMERMQAYVQALGQQLTDLELLILENSQEG